MLVGFGCGEKKHGCEGTFKEGEARRDVIGDRTSFLSRKTD